MKRKGFLRGAVVSLAGAFLLPFLGVSSPVNDPFTSNQRDYWAFQKVERPAVPKTSHTGTSYIGWVRNPIDAFVAAKLENKDIEPAARADKVTLIRRATFDLIGLPPSPPEVKAFVEDDSPEAFQRVVNRLLDSPHYGERWGRHWLDLARYSDSEGFKSDETRPNAWRYRDYVIKAFNDDKPYDLFVKEQIAGDELWPGNPDAHVATAFNRHFPDESNAANLQQRRQEILHDITDTVGATFLGLTFGCAKCHDHKFDPILQKDYYRLQAFFANTAEYDEVPMVSPAELREQRRKLAVWKEATKDIRAEIDELFKAKRDEDWAHQVGRRTPETQRMLDREGGEHTPYERQILRKHNWEMKFLVGETRMAKGLKGEEKERYEQLQAKLAKYERLHPGELPLGTGVKDLGREASPTHVLGVSSYDAPGEEVRPGFLSILDPKPAVIPDLPYVKSTGRRTALAHWVADRDNPLTARVIVNRLWHYHFGRGIVATPSDFGRMGGDPTHPELLDWLAAEFVDNGWSVKQMHRLMMNSAAYQQSSAFREDANRADSMNRLFWRFPPQRLEAEVIRDSALYVSGMLDPAMGGPSVFPPLPPGMPKPWGGWDVTEDPTAHRRRSIYVFVRRNARYPMLEAFDMPDTHESCARRTITTTAPQALALLNSEQTVNWARGFAGRVLQESGANFSSGVVQAYEVAFSREPDGWEKDQALTFLERQAAVIAKRQTAGEKLALPTTVPDGLAEPRAAAFVDFCHTLLNANEFVYRF